MFLTSGSLLNDRYRIDEVIAKGGMGAIYRAFDVTLNIDVAVKENFYTGDDHSRQFRREATILANLHHPHLPRVTDHFIIPNQGQYLVMDYIAGEDLRSRTNRAGPIPEDEVVRVGCAISDALDYLHHRLPPVVHRDIKPGNIKVSPDGGVFLVDFGLAKISQAGQNTTTGAQALTPGYAPPEQYGQGTEPRSDIYALGATLYAVLTGKVPEDGLARAMGTVELTPVRTHKPQVTEQTAWAIEKAMAVMPKDRFQTGSEFKLALCDSSLPERPAEPTQGAYRPAPANPAGLNRPQKRGALTRWTALFGAAAVLAILAGAFIFVILPGIPRPPAAIATTPTHTIPSATLPQEVAIGETSLPPPTLLPSQTIAPTETPTGTPAPSPTLTFTPAGTPLGGGAEIAFASDRSGIPQIWAVQPDGSSLRQITQLPDGACQPDWDSQKTRIVFVSPCREKADSYPGASLYIINSDGTGLVLLPTLPGGDFDPDWSPDGQTIVFTSLRDSRPNIYLIQLADKSVTRLSSPVNYERHPAWSPDGTTIAYETTRGGFPQIWMMEADGANPHEFSLQTGGRSSYPAWSPNADILVYTQGGSPTFLVSRRLDDPQAAEFRFAEQLYPVARPAFSPDGWWLAASALVDGNDDIYILMRNGSSLTRLTDNPAADFDPSWR